MSDYFEELGHEPTGPEGANDLARNFRRLQVLAIMNGIDMEIEVPEASKRAIAELPVHEILASEVGGDMECSVCKEPAQEGEKYKILPCKHEFHEECILLWLKKVMIWENYEYILKYLKHFYPYLFLLPRPIPVPFVDMNWKQMILCTRSFEGLSRMRLTEDSARTL